MDDEFEFSTVDRKALLHIFRSVASFFYAEATEAVEGSREWSVFLDAADALSDALEHL